MISFGSVLIINKFYCGRCKQIIKGDVNMQKQISNTPVEKGKIILIMSLFAFTILIMLSGAFFSVFSLVNHISFTVLNAHIHGALFGLMVIYFGIRNYFSVKKLKTEVYKNTSRFSWSNFKKEKTHRLAARSR
jgi:hypothetical protein